MKEELLKIVDKYYENYKLPELKVNDGEWEALLTTITKYLPNNAMDAVNIVLRKAFNIALANNEGYFNLYYIVLALDDLNVFNLSTDIIHNIKNEVMLESLKNNVQVKSK